MAGEKYATHEYDVIVVGAGGAGLRAAIEASAAGARTALLSKSLLGKAGTVMAEGGIAAALGSVDPEDGWQAHFRDTMRGGSLLNDWRMAQIHAQEAAARVLELEQWGALFDRAQDGLMMQHRLGGHRRARAARAGNHTGRELVRTLQQVAVHKGIDVHMECSIQRLLTQGGRVAGAFGYMRASGELVVFRSKAVVLATGGGSRAWKLASGPAEHTGDGAALAAQAGAELMDMEFIQFHPTGMVWPPGARGMLVTEGVRTAGGILKNSAGRRFMFDRIPDSLKAATAATEEEADAWHADPRNNRQPPELLPCDVVARGIEAEVKAGRGTAHGGVFLDIASRLAPDEVSKRLASTHRQCKQLAGVDIATQAIEVGPTCHYAIGGVRVDAETTATTLPGLFAAGEAAAGLHGANRLGGNSLSELLVFGRRAGLHAARYAGSLARNVTLDNRQVERSAREVLAPFARRGGEDPYILHAELQACMQELVGLTRTQSGLRRAAEKIRQLKRRAGKVSVAGGRAYNPGWHLALELRALLSSAQATVAAAIERRESRGAHARSDFPAADAKFAGVNLVVKASGDGFSVSRQPLREMPDELRRLLVPDELKNLLEESYTWLPRKSGCGSGAEMQAAESSRTTG